MSAGRRLAVRAAALALCLMSGCQGPVTLHNTYEGGQREVEAGAVPAAARKSCVVVLGDIVDRRESTEVINDSAGIPIHHEDLLGWLRKGVTTLRVHDVAFVPPEQEGVHPRVDIDLVKAYLQHLSVAMSANLVVRVHIAAPGKPPVEKYLRGRDTGFNWATGEGEVQAAFDQALTQVVAGLYGEIKPLCA